MVDTNKFASITSVEGGFIVELGGATQVTTSLQKAVGLLRAFLKGDTEETPEA